MWGRSQPDPVSDIIRRRKQCWIGHMHPQKTNHGYRQDTPWAGTQQRKEGKEDQKTCTWQKSVVDPTKNASWQVLDLDHQDG